MFPSINWNLFSLELSITITLVVLIVVDIFLPKDTRKDWIATLSYFALLGIGVFWFSQKNITGETFEGMFSVDSLSWFFKGIFLLTTGFVFVMTQQFFKSLPQRKNEFYLLLWLALLGMCLMASSSDFLLLFLAIEILTISLYVMTAYLKSDNHSLEAGMKYLILGSLSSGFFLYGMSFLYGETHSTRFAAVRLFADAHTMSPMLLLGLMLIFSAIGFKIASVPFQMWVPDVYQGAPTPVTALLSVGSKAAGFIVLIRLVFEIFASWHFEWTQLLATLSAITMCYGNLAAMFQKNIQRLLGYSSIGQAGYLLMGAAAGSALGVAAINFYLVGYLFTNLAAFLVIILFSIAVKSDELDDYAGLSQRSGLLAGALLIALVSLAGVPPLVGFFGKFTLLMAAVKSDLVWLALVAGVNIVISLYYYLMVVKRIYVDPPKITSPIPVSLPLKLILWITILAIVGIGIFQGPLLESAMTAVKGMSVK